MRGGCSFVSVYYDSANVGVSSSYAMDYCNSFLSRKGGLPLH